VNDYMNVSLRIAVSILAFCSVRQWANYSKAGAMGAQRRRSQMHVIESHERGTNGDHRLSIH